MKRKKFIAATLATAMLPLIGKSFGMLNQAEVDKGFKINRGEGRLNGHIKLKGVNAMSWMLKSREPTLVEILPSLNRPVSHLVKFKWLVLFLSLFIIYLSNNS